MYKLLVEGCLGPKLHIDEYKKKYEGSSIIPKSSILYSCAYVLLFMRADFHASYNRTYYIVTIYVCI